MESIQEYALMTTPQEDAELRDITIKHFNLYEQGFYKTLLQCREKLEMELLARDEQREREIRRVAKMENARDFSAVVKAFNEALSAGFDAPSVRSLRMVINGADARANYIDLPEQLTNPQEQDKEEE